MALLKRLRLGPSSPGPWGDMAAREGQVSCHPKADVSAWPAVSPDSALRSDCPCLPVRRGGEGPAHPAQWCERRPTPLLHSNPEAGVRANAAGIVFLICEVTEEPQLLSYSLPPPEPQGYHAHLCSKRVHVALQGAGVGLVVSGWPRGRL